MNEAPTERERENGVNVTGLRPGSTTITIQAGDITASLPVTVREDNLIAYGPGQKDGLTFVIEEDGGLHVSGSAVGWWDWVWPLDQTGLAGQTLTLTPGTFPKRFDSYIVMTDGGGKVTRKAGTFTCPDTLTGMGFAFRHASTMTDPDPIDAIIHPMLNLGGTGLAWSRPANTEASLTTTLTGTQPNTDQSGPMA